MKQNSKCAKRKKFVEENFGEEIHIRIICTVFGKKCNARHVIKINLILF